MWKYWFLFILSNRIFDLFSATAKKLKTALQMRILGGKHPDCGVIVCLFWLVFSLFVFYCFRFLKPAPMFLDSNFKRLSKISNYLPPFGVRTQGISSFLSWVFISRLFHHAISQEEGKKHAIEAYFHFKFACFFTLVFIEKKNMNLIKTI